MEIRPESISRFKKEKYLRSLSEDDFRDLIIRPLFHRMGFGDGRDLCGPLEKGKDTVFTSATPWGTYDLYAVQTKIGSLNMGKSASQNVVEAVTQLKTAAQTKIPLIKTKEKKYPNKVILCTSGKINETAKDYIIEEVKDSKLEFMDSDEIIPLIDKLYPELWYGIDSELLPYFRSLKKNVEEIGFNDLNYDLLSKGDAVDAATDDMFVPLRLHRTILKLKKSRGKMIHEPKFEEFPVTGIISRKEKLFLIQGEAGSGKSTALRRIAYVLANKGLKNSGDYVVPILLRSVDIRLKDNSNSLVAICLDETKRITNSPTSSFGTKELNEGRVLVLIDALDEIANIIDQEVIVKKIIEFHNNYPNCKIVLTSRNESFLNKIPDIQKFSVFNISPISYKEVDQILKRFEKKQALTKESSKEIMRRLQDIHGMELNPLLVTIFAATSDYSRKDIPANITELFKKFTEMMLGRWDERKGLSQQFHAPLKDFILCQIAFEMHRRKTTHMELNEFKSILEKELRIRGHEADVNQLTEEILSRSNLFRIIQNRIEFRHHLLQEFFAGRGIPSSEYLQSIVYDLWWQRAIVFYFGENPQDSKGLNDIAKFLNTSSIEDNFTASLTLGLALQAAYLVIVEDKIDLLDKVIHGISVAKDEVIEKVLEGDYPLRKFITYYLIGRDSVACSFIESNIEKLMDQFKLRNPSEDEEEIFTFWLIVGLIESGSIIKAEQLIKKYRPKDNRLLLAIHLGCFLVANLRVTTKNEKKVAENIMHHLGDRIKGLREKFLNEFKSELLELRKGSVVAIDKE